MKCSNCQHENQGGKFCEQCGAPLTETAENDKVVSRETVNHETSSSTVSASETPEAKPSNNYAETTKKIAEGYFVHFREVVKKPYNVCRTAESESFTNGLITYILYSLFIPLICYFGLKNIMSGISSYSSGLYGSDYVVQPSFFDMVIIPFFACFVFTVLMAFFAFISLKLGHVNVDFKDVFARFGLFLMPIIVIFAVGLILSILKVQYYTIFLALGLVCSMFIVPALVIVSYKKDKNGGLDVFYGTLLTYILIFILILMMVRVLFESLLSIFNSLF